MMQLWGARAVLWGLPRSLQNFFFWKRLRQEQTLCGHHMLEVALGRVAVVFDANSYVSLGKEEFPGLLASERQHSVVGYCTFWTAMELLAHLADRDDPAFSRSWQAIHRLVAHCSEYDGGRDIIRFLADSDSQLAMDIFGVRSPHREKFADSYGNLLGKVVRAATPTDLAPLAADLTGIRDHVAATEARFTESLFTHVIQAMVPQARSWSAIAVDPAARSRLISFLGESHARAAAAAMIAYRVAEAARVEIAMEDLETVSAKILDLVPAAVEFYLAMLRKMALDGFDVSVPKHANSVWDFQILHSANKHTRVDGMPLWVVSSDGPVRAAASATGIETLVLAVSEYRRLLALTFDDFRVISTP